MRAIARCICRVNAGAVAVPCLLSRVQPFRAVVAAARRTVMSVAEREGDCAARDADGEAGRAETEAGRCTGHVYVRPYFEGQRPNRAVVLKCPGSYDVVPPTETSGMHSRPTTVVKGSTVLDVLQKVEIDRRRFMPMFFEERLQGNIPLQEDDEIHISMDLQFKGVPSGRVDVLWKRTTSGGVSDCPVPSIRDTLDEVKAKGRETPTGWYGIGVLRQKSAANHGTLWRSAYQMGASYIFSIGARYSKQTEGSADTVSAWTRLPCLQYTEWEDFVRTVPYGAKWVAVELGGESLETFEHPRRAVYILGSEDLGLPPAVVEACHHHISIPTTRMASFNVAVAGSIVMYDRKAKMDRASAKGADDDGGGRSYDLATALAVHNGLWEGSHWGAPLFMNPGDKKM